MCKNPASGRKTCIHWDICWVASEPALAPSLNLYQSGEHHLPLPGDSLRTYFVQPKYHQRDFQWLSLTGIQQVEAGRGRSQHALWPSPSPVWVKDSLSVQLGPFCTHLGPAETTTNCGSLCSSSLPMGSHKQHLTLASTRILPKRPQWPALDDIRAGLNKLHKCHIQRVISAGIRPC